MRTQLVSCKATENEEHPWIQVQNAPPAMYRNRLSPKACPSKNFFLKFINNCLLTDKPTTKHTEAEV